MNKASPPPLRAELEDSRRVIVKFHDQILLPYVDGVEKHFAKVSKRLLSEWGQLSKEVPGLKMGRIFTSIRAGRLTQLVAQAKIQDLSYRPPNFQNYFGIEVPDSKACTHVVSALAKWEKLVHSACIEPPGGEPTTGIPVLPDDAQAGNQFHLAYAPIGIDARYAWCIKGGDGENQTLVDFERGWNTSHPDLPKLGISVLTGTNSPSSQVQAHGNAVLGIICAVDNGLQCLGITPNLHSIGLASYASGINRANAILEAIQRVPFGSVLLIEASVLKDGRPHPIEVFDLEYEAIRLATALGIVVVEAAANGGVSLDTAITRESFAIMVGAGKAPLDPPLKQKARDYLRPTTDPLADLPASTPLPYTRVPTSNFGQRVNCFAWGEQVTTLTNTNFTNGFQETSAAAAIIAGTALAVQGIVEAAFGRRLDSSQMRALLETNGTPAATTDHIGVMPDLRQIVNNVLGLGEDDQGRPISPDVLQLLSQRQITPPFEIYIRDYGSDTGLPHETPVTFSSDVWISTTNDAPDINFDTTSHPPATLQLPLGQAQYIYTRVWNRGVLDATNVPIKIYQANAATILTPTDWQIVDLRTIPVVPANSSAVIEGPFMWDANSLSTPSQEEYLIVLVDNATEPNYLPKDFKTQSRWQKFVSRNPKVTLVKFQVS